MSRGRDSAGSSVFPSPITFLELTTKGMLLKSPSPFSANDSEQDCSTLSSAGKERGNPSCDITLHSPEAALHSQPASSRLCHKQVHRLWQIPLPWNLLFLRWQGIMSLGKRKEEGVS